MSSGTTLLVGAPGRCSGRRAQLKPPFPVPVGRGRSYTAPGAPGLHSPRRCRVKKEHTCWPHLDRNVEVNPGRRLSFASKVCLWGRCGPTREKKTKKGESNPLPPPRCSPSPPRGEACAHPEALHVPWHSPLAFRALLVIDRLACVTPSPVPDSETAECRHPPRVWGVALKLGGRVFGCGRVSFVRVKTGPNQCKREHE